MAEQKRRRVARYFEQIISARPREDCPFRCAETACGKLHALEPGGVPGRKQLSNRVRPGHNFDHSPGVAESGAPTLGVREGMEVTYVNVGARHRHAPHLAGQAMHVTDMPKCERAD